MKTLWFYQSIPFDVRQFFPFRYLITTIALWDIKNPCQKWILFLRAGLFSHRKSSFFAAFPVFLRWCLFPGFWKRFSSFFFDMVFHVFWSDWHEVSDLNSTTKHFSPYESSNWDLHFYSSAILNRLNFWVSDNFTPS